jgi:hypothetical protein
MQWTMTIEGLLGHSFGPGVGNQNGTCNAFTDIDCGRNFWSDYSHRLPPTTLKTLSYN